MVAIVEDGARGDFVVATVAVTQQQRVPNADLLVGDADQLWLLSIAVLCNQLGLDMRARVGWRGRRLFRWSGLGAIGGRLRSGIFRHLHEVAGRPEGIACRRLLRVNEGSAGERKDGADQHKIAS